MFSLDIEEIQTIVGIIAALDPEAFTNITNDQKAIIYKCKAAVVIDDEKKKVNIPPIRVRR